MKKTLYGFLSIALLMCIGFFQKNTEPAKVALERVAAQYKNSLDLFEAQINRYAEVAESFSQKKADLFTLQKTHRETRLALKEVEFLMSYLDPVAVKNFINGAPLPKPEPNIPELRAFEPKGLQVLDELVYGDEVFDLRDSISFQASTLKKNFKLVKNYTGSLSLEHRFVFEAIRQELIRVFTLGVTGFDTPGSSHALPEADISMQTISKVISAYYPMLSKLDYSLQQEMAVQFTQAIIYIKNHNNFETFNRLEFLTNFINPLYENVLKAQKTLGIEDYYEAVGFNTKLNHKGTNLFSDDFINAFTYSGLKKNEFTQKRAELGKILFFDPLLSANNEGACATCHNPDKGFADGIAKSPAMNGEGTILRNAPGLVNSVFAEKYFYDLREKVLARQIKHVVLNPKEFNTTFTDIEDKIKQSQEYQELFAEAYPTINKEKTISRYSISDALANYIAELYSFNSEFDQYVKGEIAEIDPSVINGFNIFMGKGACGTCHFAPTFNGLVPPLYSESESEVLGVPATTDSINPQLDADVGRIDNGINPDLFPFYAHSFKTVTVRNVALTAPYMHNGVYNTLEEVMDFYNKGGGSGMGIDVAHQTLPDAPLGLTKKEISDVISFMEALTDTTNLTNRPVMLPKFKEHPEWNNRPIGGKDY